MTDNQEKSEGTYQQSPAPVKQQTGKKATTPRRKQTTAAQKKSSGQQKGSTSPAQQQTGGAAIAAPGKQDQVAQQSQKLTPDWAVSEFAQIVNSTNTVSVTSFFQASQVECPEKPRWCLPDVNCTARDAIKAFKENQEFCKGLPEIVN